MILNRQNRIRINQAVLARFEARLRRALRLGRRGMTICFVDDREMARLNRAFRGKPKPTDVLSFPANGTGNSGLARGESRNYLGDIAISPQTARKNAVRFERTLDNELRVLMLHGALHLMGHDHESDHGEMERKENRLRRKLRLG